MIEIFKDKLSPSIEDTLKIGKQPFDTTGSTGKFSMRPELSTVLKVNRADVTFLQTGVAPNIVNEGLWRWDPTAPDVDAAGFFLGWLTVILPSGKEQDQDEFVVVVREHGSSIDLCSIADVKRYIGETSDDYDDEIADLVAAASQAFLSRTRRELRPFTANPSTRVFDIDADVIAERSILPGDLASFSNVVIKAPDGTLMQTVDVSTVVGLPRIREPWRPIAELAFLRGLTGSAILSVGGSRYGAPGYTLEVTGSWGFPQVPADIRREVKKIAAAGLARDVKRTSKTFSEQAPGFTAGGSMHEFPLSAEQCAARYRDRYV